MTQYAFFRGEFVPIEQAKISVMTHALHYGTACFAGIRGYWNEEQGQLYVFRLRDHFKRFLASIKFLLIELPYDVDALCDIAVELLRREGWREDVYLRPLAYKSDTGIGVRLHDLQADVTMFSVAFGRYIDKEEGAHVTFSSWRRVDDNAIPPRGKLAGAYVNSALIKSEAVLNGFDEGLVMDQVGHVVEGSAENLFLVRDGRIYTPPVTDNILEGITRRTLMTLMAKEMDLTVVERSIDRSEVYLADELFLCGTGAQVSAVVKVDQRPIGSGQIGPVASRLRELYFDVVRGRNPKYRDWCTPVY